MNQRTSAITHADEFLTAARMAAPYRCGGQGRTDTCPPREPWQDSRASGALRVALGRHWASAQRSLITSAAMTVMLPDATTM